MMNNKTEALNNIRTNISNHGLHVYAVEGGPSPRRVYSIGLNQAFGIELVLAGASFYSTNEASEIVNSVSDKVRSDPEWRRSKFELGSLGVFTLREVDVSWGEKLMLGVLDYYNITRVDALQIVPDQQHWTIDVPDMSSSWNAGADKVWRWLEEAWNYPVSKTSVAITNMDVLRGNPITEAMRWEDNEWELFAGAGPDVKKRDIRIVPLGTLLAADASAEAVAELQVGEGIWRDAGESKWHSWKRKS